jgi:hypothetical protein
MNTNQTLKAKKNNGKNIFVSYREKDSSGETGRLVDSLKQHFEDDQIFLDIDKIEPGVDFSDAISHSLECCDVMLAIIGPQWMGMSNETSRIKKEGDWVRLEIATALERKIRVVPVLVDGAELPNAEELPEDLQALLKRQAYEISNKRWRYDTDQLIEFLEKNIGVIPRKIDDEKPVKKVSLSGTVKLVLLIAGGFFILSIVLYAMGIGQEPEPINHNNPPIHNNNDGPGTEQDYNNPDNNVKNITGNTTPEKIPVKNIEGTWMDANGLYYLVIAQDGEELGVTSYALSGDQSGEGSGYIEGNKVNMSINVFNVGNISLRGTLSNDNKNFKGTSTIESDGTPYTEALHLVKNNKAAY